MPRAKASGDDVVVGHTVHSTTVDPLKGIGTTLPASRSNVDKADDAGKQDAILRPTRKFGVKALAIKRAPT